MKKLVNGVAVELEDSNAEVLRSGNRLIVRTAEGSKTAFAVRKGDDVLVSYRGRTYKIEPETRARQRQVGGSGELHAPMPGVIVDVLAVVGQEVKQGDKVVVLEAMKTQQALVAPFNGVVDSVNVNVGDQVVGDALLAVVRAVEA